MSFAQDRIMWLSTGFPTIDKLKSHKFQIY